MKNIGVQSIGVKTPIIKAGDDIVDIVVKSVLNAFTTYVDGVDTTVYDNRIIDLQDRDVIGITESVVARAANKYVTLDEIGESLLQQTGENKKFYIYQPIYSRNRFSMVLKAIARVADEIIIQMPAYDEVGNPSEVNPFTGVNIKEYYSELCQNEGVCPIIVEGGSKELIKECYEDYKVIICNLHDYDQIKDDFISIGIDAITLADICSDKCLYGLYGTNKATEEKLKLFPDALYAQAIVDAVQTRIKDETGKTVEVMVYGDGCFKDPVGGIWEFADPVVSPAYTSGLVGTPNEIKIKAFADEQFDSLDGEELDNAIKNAIKENNTNLVGNMASQGTTPRRYIDLLGSLMDLTSGSGSKGTPVIVVKNYFNTYAD